MTNSIAISPAAISSIAYSLEAWQAWQAGVVSVIREEFRELFASVHHDDFDWDAWRPLYEEGWLPADAVKLALSRNSDLVGPGTTAASESKDLAVTFSGSGFSQTMAVD